MANSIVTGKVNNHAKPILTTVDCKFLTPPVATIVPATPDDNTWVVPDGQSHPGR